MRSGLASFDVDERGGCGEGKTSPFWKADGQLGTITTMLLELGPQVGDDAANLLIVTGCVGEAGFQFIGMTPIEDILPPH